jgi:hypothetical protein
MLLVRHKVCLVPIGDKNRATRRLLGTHAPCCAIGSLYPYSDYTPTGRQPLLRAREIMRNASSEGRTSSA